LTNNTYCEILLDRKESTMKNYPSRKLSEIKGVFEGFFISEPSKETFNEYKRQCIRFQFLLEILEEEMVPGVLEREIIDEIIGILASNKNPFNRLCNTPQPKNLEEAFEFIDLRHAIFGPQITQG